MENKRYVWYALTGLFVLLLLMSIQMIVQTTSFYPAGSRPDISLFQKPKTPTLPPARSRDPWTGASSTEAVVVTIFGDMTDLSTRTLEPAVVALLTEQPNDVKIIWRDVIIASDRPDAILAAAAGRCAHEQNKFWQFRSQILSSTGNLTIQRLQEYARMANIDVGVFNLCLESGKDTQSVQEDNSIAIEYNITSLPQVFVESKPLRQDIGANSLRWEVLKAMVKK